MSERTLLKGRLAEAELEIESLRLTCENNMITVRQLIDPFSAVEDLQLDRAAVAMKQLQQNQKALKEKLGLVKKLDRDLHG